MTNTSLSQLVRIDKRKHGHRLAAYLGFFETFDSIEDVIRFACPGKDGNIHAHQHLVGKAKLRHASRTPVSASQALWHRLQDGGEVLEEVENHCGLSPNDLLCSLSSGDRYEFATAYGPARLIRGLNPSRAL